MGATITFITGGQRSGKSRHAQELAEKNGTDLYYLATSRVWDDDFKERIKRHQSDRDERWTTIEEEVHLSKLDLTGKTVVLDCITLWLTNIFYDNNSDLDQSLTLAKNEWNTLIQQDCNLIVVSNELGMGLHPMEEMSRKFTDMQGWMNQHIAASAEHVLFMVSGIPLVTK